MIELADRSVADRAGLTISCACRALGVSRATFYRHRLCAGGDDADIGLRDRIQHIALEMPSYGYRRITAQLRRDGCPANHKRVLRLMRQDNLLCLRKRGFVLTTDSEHALRVYPNLAKDIVLERINQLWVSDITYVRLEREFVYLSVVLDAFSRRCVGWGLGRRLDTELALKALEMALESRQPDVGLVHHSDRGVQYASAEYTQLLEGYGIRISMSRRANPYDNAYAESFIKTLKYEEVYLGEYLGYEDAKASIGHFIEEVYNLKRLHSSLGYVPPNEYEQMLQGSRCPVYA